MSPPERSTSKKWIVSILRLMRVLQIMPVAYVIVLCALKSLTIRANATKYEIALTRAMIVIPRVTHSVCIVSTRIMTEMTKNKPTSQPNIGRQRSRNLPSLKEALKLAYVNTQFAVQNADSNMAEPAFDNSASPSQLETESVVIPMLSITMRLPIQARIMSTQIVSAFLSRVFFKTKAIVTASKMSITMVAGKLKRERSQSA